MNERTALRLIDGEYEVSQSCAKNTHAAAL